MVLPQNIEDKSFLIFPCLLFYCKASCLRFWVIVTCWEIGTCICSGVDSQENGNSGIMYVLYSNFPVIPFYTVIVTHSLVQQMWSPKYCAGPAEGPKKV